MSSVYAPCPACHGAGFNASTLKVTLRGKNVGEDLHMTVSTARDFFADDAPIERPLASLQDIGLGSPCLG